MILRVTMLQQRGDAAEILRVTASAMRKLAAVYFPAYVFFLIFRREVITLLFTARYTASANIFAINLLLLPMAVLLYDPLFRAYIDQRFFLLRLRLVLCSVMAAGLWLAIGHFGLLGAISTVVIISATERALTLARICRILGVRGRDIRLLQDVGKLAVAAAFAGGAAFLAPAVLGSLKPVFILAAGGAVFVCVYAAAVFVLRIVTEEERAFVLQKLALAWSHWAAPAAR